jgi:hypothetical protein
MKYLDKIGIVAASLILALTLAVTASAGHGGFNQRQINQAIRAQQRQNNRHHNNQQIVFVPVQQQRVVYVPNQQFRQNFNDDCHQNDGQLQFRQNFNGSNCGQLYR